MSSTLRKIKRNKSINLSMGIKFKCPICGFERLIPQQSFQNMTNESFKNNKLFFCDKCDIKMNPITIEVDY